jgi:hypothetical protein
MWELIDIFIAVGLAGFGTVVIGALLCLDARNEGHFNSSKERPHGARHTTTTQQSSEGPQGLNNESPDRPQAAPSRGQA